jgi:intracellular sulfur oxidation DsrE/DsrF family protein
VNVHDDKHHDDKHHDEKHHDEERGRKRRTTLVISNCGMGHAPAELGLKLIQSHLGLLDADDRVPYAICLYGEGVKLAVEGSPVLDELRSLAEKGARVVVCTTCLNFFGLADSLQAGEAGSMKDIIELQWGAKRVITL